MEQVMKKTLDNFKSSVEASRHGDFVLERTVHLGSIQVSVFEAPARDDLFPGPPAGPVVQKIEATRNGEVVARFELQHYFSSGSWHLFEGDQSLGSWDFSRPSDDVIDALLSSRLLTPT